jgi:hypothetical protein
MPRAAAKGEDVESRLGQLVMAVSPPIAADVVALRRELAAAVLEREGYPWG